MVQERCYPGIDADHHGDMTPIGIITRDARAFGIPPEPGICAGWSQDRLQIACDQLARTRETYGHPASRLPEVLQDRHGRIHGEAVTRARITGWSAEPGDDG